MVGKNNSMLHIQKCTLSKQDAHYNLCRIVIHLKYLHAGFRGCYYYSKMSRKDQNHDFFLSTIEKEMKMFNGQFILHIALLLFMLLNKRTCKNLVLSNSLIDKNDLFRHYRLVSVEQRQSRQNIANKVLNAFITLIVI